MNLNNIKQLASKSALILALSFLHLFHPAYAANDLEVAMRNPNNWAAARGQYNNQGYSALNQITPKNIANLKLAWTFSTGVNRGHEGAPLVIDGVMYVHTAFPNNIYALDLNNEQKILWSYFPKQSPQTQAIFCCDNVNRGLSYGDGKIYLQQNNGILVALNAKTGEPVWQTQVNDPATGASNSNAPLVIKDKVLTGCAGGEFGVRCFIAAYYLKDGALAWKAYSTGPDSEVLIGKDFNQHTPHYSALSVYADVNGGNVRGGSFTPIPNDALSIAEPELGIRTWLQPQQVKDGWQNGGGAVTGYVAYDQKTNLVYYGTGNPGVWNPDVRPGDNKWSSSVFARDVDSGMAKWAMQTTPHDEWDYDATNEVILFDKNRKTYATQINKNGFLYTWQANTGQLVAAEKVHPFVNWASGVDLQTGVPAKVAGFSTHTDINMTFGCPSTAGVKGVASPAAYSPKAELLYVPLNHMCMTYEPVESKYVAGQPWVGATFFELQGPITFIKGEYVQYREERGALGAYLPTSGQLAWYHMEKLTLWGGALVTASNLVFYGTLDRWFKALDAKTGNELWRFQVGSGVIGNPFTYQLKGKQYVGVLSGIGGLPGAELNRYLMDMDRDCGICDVGTGYRNPLANQSARLGAGTLNIFSL